MFARTDALGSPSESTIRPLIFSSFNFFGIQLNKNLSRSCDMDFVSSWVRAAHSAAAEDSARSHGGI